MPTIFWFPSNVRADITVVPAPGWSGTGTVSRWMMRTLKGSSPTMSWPMYAFTGTAAGNKMLDRQYISYPLKGDQTISGYCSGRLQVAESASNDNVDRIVTSLRVVSRDGLTIRGTGLVTSGRGGPVNEFSSSTTYTVRGMITGARITTGNLISTVNALDGDRLVLEIGYENSTAGISVGAGARWGDSAAPCNVSNETTTTASAGWFAMDATLQFYHNDTTARTN